MKRAPIDPRNPIAPSSGLTIFTPVAVASISSSFFRFTIVSTDLRHPYTSATLVSSEMSKTRTYELKRRAERQEETRQRIVDAAVELHTTLGPSRTTVQAIAEKAGVTRPTVYAHFPDARSLFSACSGHVRATIPPPNPARWESISDPAARLETALRELYAYYTRLEPL